MCGIIARISYHTSPKRTLEILSGLENRGYDSQGIFFSGERGDQVVKTTGTFEHGDISERIKSNLEIAHTRWATHGKVSRKNAHPISDLEERVHVVMNGTIENESDIRQRLIDQGYKFKSETDTELIPALYSSLKEFDNESIAKRAYEIKEELEGEFSYVAFIDGKLVAYKNSNPLVISETNENDEILICSEARLIGKYSDEFTKMEDDDLAIIEKTEDGFNISNYNLRTHFTPIQSREKREFNFREEEGNGTDFSSRMEKEIYDQSQLENNLANTLDSDEILEIQELIKQTKGNVIVSGAGSSYYISQYMQNCLMLPGIMSFPIVASELESFSRDLSRTNQIEDSTLVVFSQSGETGDLLTPIKKFREEGANIISITNNEGSTIDDLSDRSLYMNCGPEKAVATTKAFTHSMAIARGISNLSFVDSDIRNNCFNVNRIIEKNSQTLDEIVDQFKDSKDFYFIGRENFAPLASEGALKLKEISYIHAEAFPAGELKHGTMALIEEDTPVISLDFNPATLNNAKEIKARGAKIIGINRENDNTFDFHLKSDWGSEFSREFSSVVLMQELARRMAIAKGLNPDRPRNLAKSVTVK